MPGHFKEQLCDRNLVIRPEEEGGLNAMLDQLEYACERGGDGTTTDAGSANQERQVSQIVRRTFIEVPWPEEPPATRRRCSSVPP